MKLYAAYGSNLNLGQMAVRCPHAMPIGTGELKNHSLHFANTGQLKGNGYLNVEPKRGESVPVGIWRISEEDESRLDAYEGCPRFYEKKKVRMLVRPFLGEPFKATVMVYYMPNAVVTSPSWHYLSICEEGYRRFGLDVEYLSNALREADDIQMDSNEYDDRWI